MKLEILSAAALQNKAKRPFAPRTTLISIGDPDALPPLLQHKPDHMLRLVFEDVTPKRLENWLELDEEAAKDADLLAQEHDTHLFTKEMAVKTALFILKHAAKTQLLICQCEYGQSRSAAVAAAVSEHLFGKGELIFSDSRYAPNEHVYQTLLSALEQIKAAVLARR